MGRRRVAVLAVVLGMVLVCAAPRVEAQRLAVNGDHFTVDDGDQTGPHARFLYLVDYTNGVEALAPWFDLPYLRTRTQADGIRVRPDWEAPGGAALGSSTVLIQADGTLQGDGTNPSGTLQQVLLVVEMAASEHLIVDLSFSRRRTDGAVSVAAYRAALVRLATILKPYGHVLFDLQDERDAVLSPSDTTVALTVAETTALVQAIRAVDAERIVVASASAASLSTAAADAAATGVSAVAYHGDPAASENWWTSGVVQAQVTALRGTGAARPVYLQQPMLWLGASGACGGAPGDTVAAHFVAAAGAARAAGAAAWVLETCVTRDLRTTTLQHAVVQEPATRALVESPPSGVPTTLWTAMRSGVWAIDVTVTVDFVGRGRGLITGGAVGQPQTLSCSVRETRCAATYPSGTPIQLSATPATAESPYYTFQGWTGADTNGRLTPTDDVTVIATFGYEPPMQTQVFALDALGSVRVARSGSTVTRHDFLPFGEEWTAPSTQVTRLFTGQQRDAETGLDYFGARYYRANLGRFTTVDPELNVNAALLDPQRWNRYAYAKNNPLAYVDRDGRWPTIGFDLHKVILRLAFPSIDSGKLQQMAEGGKFADAQFSDPWYSFAHAMRDGTRQQSTADAQARYAQWIGYWGAQAHKRRSHRDLARLSQV